MSLACLAVSPDISHHSRRGDATGSLAGGGRGEPDVLSATQVTAGVMCAAIERLGLHRILYFLLRNISKTPICLFIYLVTREWEWVQPACLGV